ncbi:MAG: tryptophan halogenase family protein [Cellvibrio sp.]|uniref:tryptophan halogenase family protein n=1 Tax=Cellvibrio sp. TaxID=1965322 RepID=UPI0031A26667
MHDTAEPIKKILIAGGGTAGWMTALILAHSLRQQKVTIELIESPEVGIIGVGEGSTPALKSFFDTLDIAEEEWMPACHATFKCGITFKDWSTKPGFESYFHPFPTPLEELALPVFMHCAQARMRGANINAHPDRFFLAATLAKNNLAPKQRNQQKPDPLYGYHFDATLLGQFLRKKAQEWGIGYRQDHILNAALDADGNISHLHVRSGDVVEADFFIDCTGFQSLLLQKALAVSFKSYANNLFNDSALALPSSISNELPSETISTALSCGWAWRIPLTNRFGNGYVYSSAFCTADAAETEMRAHLGLLSADVDVRHLKMKIGRVEEHWKANCVAVGLAQGFIEPLEATALYLVQQTTILLGQSLAKNERGLIAQQKFNQEINGYFDGVRDYIVTHYKTSSRTDSEYWRANTANPRDVSATMLQLYEAWFSGKNLATTVAQLKIGQYYAAPSWYCIFAGMSIWGNPARLRPPHADEVHYDLADLDQLIADTSRNFINHRAYLEKLEKAGKTGKPE